MVLTFRDWAFALKVLAAALLALGLALWIDLPRPYWAVSTVFITSQPLAGATRSKAAYRVYGTLLGAIAAVILVPNLVNAPEILTVAIALWIGACLYFSLLDRTPRSYVLMLAGYTAAFIGFPDVSDPGTIFDVAVARAEEITLGILCATLVASIVLPQSVAPAIRCKLDQWFHEAYGWSRSVLGRERTSDDQTRRLRLACGAIAFDALATPLRHDMTGAERSAEAMETLRQHMLMFLPVVSAIADRIQALELTQGLPSKLRQNLNDMVQSLEPGTTEPLAAKRLRTAIAETDPKLGLDPTWGDLLIASLAARLKDFIDLRQDASILQRHVLDATPARETLSFRYTAGARRIRHRDPGMALLSAVAAFLAVLLAGAIWIATGWPDGSAAPMMAAVGCSFFAIQDDPASQIIDLAKSGLIGAVGATVYLFAILPLATGFEMLSIALAPALVICALLMTQPRTALIGMGTAVIGFTLLALQDSYNSDFMPFANSAVAVIIGLWIAAVVTRLVRSVGGAWSARRLRRINRRSLVAATVRHGPADGLELAALMLDRIGLLAPRLAALPPDDAEWTAELLSEVRVGINLVELQRIQSGLSVEQAGETDRLMSALGRHFGGDAVHPPAEVLVLVDACLALLAADEENAVRHDALLGFTDLRRSLFPKAAPYGFDAASALYAGVAA
jgi:uncharacterized membrane protein YccC